MNKVRLSRNFSVFTSAVLPSTLPYYMYKQKFVSKCILRDVWSSPPVTIPVGERKYCAVWRNTGRTSPERRNTGWWFPYIGNTLEPLKRQQRKQRYCCTRWFMGSRIMLMDKMNMNFIQNDGIFHAL